HDIASFADAIQNPPNNLGPGVDGVVVQLSGLPSHPAGAKGDGKDIVYDVEDIIGSQYVDDLNGKLEDNRIHRLGGNDHLAGWGGTDIGFGGQGSDICDGFAQSESCNDNEPPGEKAEVEVEDSLGGSATLSVLGRDQNDDITLLRSGSD